MADEGELMAADHDRLERDRQLADDLAYFADLLGTSPRPSTTDDPSVREQYERRHTAAVARAEAKTASRRRHSRRRFIGAVAGAALAVAATATGGIVAAGRRPPRSPDAAPPQRSPYAATPDRMTLVAAPSGDDHLTLDRLADIAERGADTRVAVDHVVIDRWDFDSVIDGRRVTSAVIPYRTQLWRAPDDRGRMVTTYQAPQFPPDADPQAWRDAGSPRGRDNDQQYSAYEFPANFRARPHTPNRPPRDPGRLAAWLVRSGSGIGAIFNGVADLLVERALTAPERGALLRMLAASTPLAFAGTTTDRAGRAGVAFTAVIPGRRDTSPSITEVLVIDPGTGRVLASEKILTAGAKGLKVRRPAVLGYRTYLLAGQVPAIG